MKNKIFFVLIIFVLSFASVFAIPQKQVEAVGFGLAVPGGITIGAGAYTLGAIGVGAVVSAFGYDAYSEEINAHAKDVWEGGTQLSKDSMNAMVSAAVGAGNSLQSIGQDFADWFQNYGRVDFTYTLSEMNKVGNVSTAGGSSNVNDDGSLISYTNYSQTINQANTFFTHNGSNYQSFSFSFPSSWNPIITFKIGSTSVNKSFGTMENAKAVTRMFQGADTGKAMALFTGYSGLQLGLKQNGVVNDIPNQYNNLNTAMNEEWKRMKDAGLVLPVDSAIPLSSVDGSPLTYNPTADNYTGIDGGVYEGTPAWAFPQPKIRVANPDIPNSVPTSGVYVDTPVLTGNPAYDDTIINNPAIPKTTTNVQTGVTVGNPDIAITEPVPPVDGGGGTPPEDGASCAKLKMPIFSPLKEQFSISFPFSIPWDIGRAINAAFSEIGDEKPEFKLDLKLMDKKHTINITLPKMFDDWKPFTDSLLLFIFDVLIMFGIYRFVKGAGS